MKLCQACIFYTSALGRPEEGLYTSNGTLSMTMDAFPDLEEAHLIQALAHMYEQAYGCPLTLTNDDDRD